MKNNVLNYLWLKLLIACTTLMIGLGAYPQFDFEVIVYDPATGNVDEHSTVEKLERVRNIVIQYTDLSDAEKQAWNGLLSMPYPNSEVPLESEFIEALFTLLETPEVRESNSYWDIMHHAFRILSSALPNSPRVSTLARDILQRDLPETLMFYPHQNLIANALSFLIQTGDADNLTFALQTENREFWADRSDGLLIDHLSVFDDDPNTATLVLQAKAPWVLAMVSPERAVPFLQLLLTREQSSTYRTYLDSLLEETLDKLKKNEETASPKGVVPRSDPFLTSIKTRGPYRSFEMDPVLNHINIKDLQPNLERLLAKSLISDSIFFRCTVLADDKSYDYHQKIEVSRSLGQVSNLPFELKRWITLQHVLLAGSLNLRDEMLSVAYDWLNRYPTDWKHLSDDWKETRFGEFNANIYLRDYLTHMFTYVSNEYLNWSMDERLRMTEETMEPAFHVEDLAQRDVIFARIFYAEALKTLAQKWIHEHREGILDKQKLAVFDREAENVEIAIAEKSLQQLELAEAVLHELITTPRTNSAHARDTVRNPRELLDLVNFRTQGVWEVIALMKSTLHGQDNRE